MASRSAAPPCRPHVERIAVAGRERFRRQPLGRGLDDELEHRRHPGGGRRGGFTLRFSAAISSISATSVNSVDLDLLVDDHVGSRAHAARQIFRHSRPERAANQQMHLARRATFGQKHRGLRGGVGAADHRHVAAVVKVGLDRGAGVINPRAQKAIGPFGLQSPPANPQGQQHHSAAANLRAESKTSSRWLKIADRAGGRELFNLDRRDDPHRT